MEKIELLSAKKRHGPVFKKTVYEKLTDLIVAQINDHPSGAINLLDLIQQVQCKLNDGSVRIQPSHILQVKVDLQERGVIKVHLDRDRNQIIEINPRNKRRRLQAVNLA